MFATDRPLDDHVAQGVEQLGVKVSPLVRILEVGRVLPVTCGSGVRM